MTRQQARQAQENIHALSKVISQLQDGSAKPPANQVKSNISEK